MAQVTEYLVHEELSDNYYYDDYVRYNEDDFVVFEEDLQDYIDHLIEFGYKRIGRHCMVFEKYDDDGDCESEYSVTIKKRVYDVNLAMKP